MKTLPFLIIALVSASVADAAPIYAKASIDGGIHLSSLDPFIVAGFWTPEMTDGSVLDNPFHVGDLIFDGEWYRLDAEFPLHLVACGGTFQIDAWAHGGWFGETQQTGRSCAGGVEPAQLVPATPEIPIDPPTVDPRRGSPLPVPEPAVSALVALALASFVKRAQRRSVRSHGTNG